MLIDKIMNIIVSMNIANNEMNAKNDKIKIIARLMTSIAS